MEIIFENYVRNLRTNSQSAALIAARLENAAPEDLSPIEKKALRAVLSAAERVHEVQSERDKLAPGKLRPVLDASSNQWSALFEALTALGRMPAEVSKDGPVAAALAQSLFPEAVGFTKLPADRAWSEAKRRLDRIAKEDLDETITRLIGAHFVVGVKKATNALGDMLGAGEEARPFASTTALQEALTAFGRAVGGYGRAMVHSVDETDAKSVDRFLRAMAPIDEYRASNPRGTNDEDPIAPEPTPPVTPVVTPTPTPVVTPTPAPTPEPVA